MREIKEGLAARMFRGAIQQRPATAVPDAARSKRLIRYDQKPRFELTVHSWDIAATKGSGDWTVCTKFGLARDEESGDVMYLTEIVRMQIELPDVREAIITQDAVGQAGLDRHGWHWNWCGRLPGSDKARFHTYCAGLGDGKINAANLKAERFS